jgi:nickel/cobalt exporter
MDYIGSAIFLLAFGTGLLHALDADHVMAVTAIASKKSGMKAIVSLCLKWSLGHGAIIFITGTVILLFGLSIPHELSHYAEKSVALLLIVIGVWILKDLYQSRAHINFHNHDGLARHAHWHIDQPRNNKINLLKQLRDIVLTKSKLKIHQHEHKHDHSAVMVGVLHGTAGLAPLLVIISVANQPRWLGTVYLLIFCLGVFLSMLIFGGVLGQLVGRLQKYGIFSVNLIRGMLGFASISLGVVWLT